MLFTIRNSNPQGVDYADPKDGRDPQRVRQVGKKHNTALVSMDGLLDPSNAVWVKRTIGTA